MTANVATDVVEFHLSWAVAARSIERDGREDSGALSSGNRRADIVDRAE